MHVCTTSFHLDFLLFMRKCILLRRAVSLVARARVLANGAQLPAVGPRQQGAIGCEAMQAALLSLFGWLCSPEGAQSVLTAHPALAMTACRLVGTYAVWFGKVQDAPALPALQMQLQALAVPQARAACPLALRMPYVCSLLLVCYACTMHVLLHLLTECQDAQACTPVRAQRLCLDNLAPLHISQLMQGHYLAQCARIPCSPQLCAGHQGSRGRLPQLVPALLRAAS